MCTVALAAVVAADEVAPCVPDGAALVGEAAETDVVALDARAEADGIAAGLIARIAGRDEVVSLLGAGVLGCTPGVPAELMPTAITAQPPTANDAAVPATIRPQAMGPVCQVWLL